MCVFDCLHDICDPVDASAHVLQALDSDGTWVIVEPFANDRVEENLRVPGTEVGVVACHGCVRIHR